MQISYIKLLFFDSFSECLLRSQKIGFPWHFRKACNLTNSRENVRNVNCLDFIKATKAKSIRCHFCQEMATEKKWLTKKNNVIGIRNFIWTCGADGQK